MVQAWSIPQASRPKSGNRYEPGPGNYNQVDLNFVREQSPLWTIKGKYPWKLDSQLSPGPAAYSLYWNRPGSSYSIQGKISDTRPDTAPGPGTYVNRQIYDHIGGYMGQKLEG